MCGRQLGRLSCRRLTVRIICETTNNIYGPVCLVTLTKGKKIVKKKKGGMYENLDDQFTAAQSRALAPGEIKSPYGEATNLSKVANNNFFGKVFRH